VSGRQTAKDDEELSEEDHQTIATIVLGWIFFSNMLMKMKPEDYAERVFLKIGKSRKKPATIRLLFDLIRETSNSVKSPDEFNQALTREMLDQSIEAVEMDNGSHLSYQEHLRRYLDRRRMSEILQYLRDRRVLRHLRGKQAIQKEMHRLPGRVASYSYDTFNERFGGKPSADVKTDNVERISKLLQKPRARSLVYDALKKTNILYNCESFMLAAFFIALKRSKRRNMNKNISLVRVIMKAVNSASLETWKIKSLLNHTVNQDENHLIAFAAVRAKESVKIHRDDAYFLMGLFRY
jgi:hypothetical protein